MLQQPGSSFDGQFSHFWEAPAAFPSSKGLSVFAARLVDHVAEISKLLVVRWLLCWPWVYTEIKY